ncbi:MAG: ATP-binding cassette domain-containing protein, partial [Burkholderiaceae bacterium]|nr:ATP-binding cassette domain-containing protein [Burkholderiaceae bacterium]
MSLLEVRNVRKSFGGVVVLDDVSMVVSPGQVCSVIGPNGAGKSTLFDIVAGVTPCDSGSILLDGVDVTRMRPDQRAARGLARTFQELRLFDTLTAHENIAAAPLCASRSSLAGILLGSRAE